MQTAFVYDCTPQYVNLHMHVIAPSNCPAGPANVYNFIHTNQAAANALQAQSGVSSDYLLWNLCTSLISTPCLDKMISGG